MQHRTEIYRQTPSTSAQSASPPPYSSASGSDSPFSGRIDIEDEIDEDEDDGVDSLVDASDAEVAARAQELLSLAAPSDLSVEHDQAIGRRTGNPVRDAELAVQIQSSLLSRIHAINETEWMHAAQSLPSFGPPTQFSPTPGVLTDSWTEAAFNPSAVTCSLGELGIENLNPDIAAAVTVSPDVLSLGVGAVRLNENVLETTLLQ